MINNDIIEDNDNLPKLLACSRYDNNHVHPVITVTDNIKLTTKKRSY